MGETRVAVMAIIVEKMESAERLNALLHEYGKYIIGRMGLLSDLSFSPLI